MSEFPVVSTGENLTRRVHADPSNLMVVVDCFTPRRDDVL